MYFEELITIPYHEGDGSYFVRNDGVILNRHGSILRTTPNQSGSISVTLRADGRYITRSVSRMVAEVFVPKEGRPEYYSRYNTVIHRDGDKTNYQASNLAWRSRSYAIKYHRQFEYTYFNIMAVKLEVEGTGEVFNNIRELCVHYGVLAERVLMMADNVSEPIWPIMRRIIFRPDL